MVHQSRALRRHHEERIFNRILYIIDDIWRYKNDMTEEERTQLANKMFSNRKQCAKACCGNPRRWFNSKTIQELRHTY